MDYYAEKAKKEIERRKERAQLLGDEWARVERKRTKEGADFRLMQNNFKSGDGGKIVLTSHYDGELYMKINVHGTLCGYESDELDITPTVYNGSKEAEHYKETGQLVERGAYLHPYAKLNADEIEQLIAERVEYWRKTAEEYAQALEHFDEWSAEVVRLRNEARAYIEKLPAHYQFMSIFEGK